MIYGLFTDERECYVIICHRGEGRGEVAGKQEDVIIECPVWLRVVVEGNGTTVRSVLCVLSYISSFVWCVGMCLIIQGSPTKTTHF